ncbi:hypothetical protein CCR94_18170 [Rhodoblastus sphagnicola]|uniref:Uncharacterized protein n=1 Tax=Rhodoblastus sphagnicola TaxID=333368 RepID=A0A2S6N0S7_9HYPH|nr:hypothetical protein [Rhodoblastus sphagnicola]MBB4200581.1 hypothetical protein [Rhodoblastus sphagnicola]PPQ28225.1 hypothetical protein CCR94_18170 [Rhodoblastus sphagnicola]
MHTAEFSLFARINDERALIKGARRHAMRANAMTAREAIKLIDGVKAALIQFLDPGVPPHPGFEILESTCETHRN